MRSPAATSRRTSSYGYRPGRRAQDAIAEIHKLTTQGYEWVVEGDITACFDNVDHQILVGLVADRIADRKVLRLVRGFLRAGIIEQHGGFAASLTGTPQGGGATRGRTVVSGCIEGGSAVSMV
jgi:RNA-directed DNA polymerase